LSLAELSPDAARVVRICAIHTNVV
jgi:hypothetical protein